MSFFHLWLFFWPLHKKDCDLNETTYWIIWQLKLCLCPVVQQFGIVYSDFKSVNLSVYLNKIKDANNVDTTKS